MATTTVDCTIEAHTIDTDNEATSFEVFTCEEGNRVHHLAHEDATHRALTAANVGPGDLVSLTLTPLDARERLEEDLTPFGRQMRLPKSTVVSRVVSVSPHHVQPEASAGGGGSVQQQLTDSGRYFEGARRIRLMSVLVSVDGEDFDAYGAGFTAADREAWAAKERRLVSEQYEFSTYGKLGFDHNRSKVKHVELRRSDLSQADLDSGCETLSFALTAAAAAKVGAESESDIDAVLYYLPKSATAVCGLMGMKGLCYPGQLKAANQQSAYPPYLDVNRASHRWNAGCWVRETFGVGAQVSAHELGHYLGLRHAAGPGMFRESNLHQYGDASAIMGNDDFTLNSFTAPARFHLGVLPPSSIASTTTGLVTLRALSTGPDPSGASHLAIALPCPSCRPRCHALRGGCVPHPPRDGVGGELWIAYRGDAETCAPDHVRDSNSSSSGLFRCHVDHSHKYNKLTVHYRQSGQYVLAEKWWWLGTGEVYSPPLSGIAIALCNTTDATATATATGAVGTIADSTVDVDSATVAIAPTVEAALAKCSGFFPPPSPPAPPLPPPTACEDAPGLIRSLIFSGEPRTCAELPGVLTASELASACRMTAVSDVCRLTCGQCTVAAPHAAPPGSMQGVAVLPVITWVVVGVAGLILAIFLLTLALWMRHRRLSRRAAAAEKHAKAAAAAVVCTIGVPTEESGVVEGSVRHEWV